MEKRSIYISATIVRVANLIIIYKAIINYVISFTGKNTSLRQLIYSDTFIFDIIKEKENNSPAIHKDLIDEAAQLQSLGAELIY